ncbi:hypothetical protein AB0L17_35280, partial [Streptomyces cellulosae]
MTGPGRAAVLAAVCLMVVMSSGCTADDSRRADTVRQSTPPAQSGATTDRAEHIAGETVTKAPQVVDG